MALLRRLRSCLVFLVLFVSLFWFLAELLVQEPNDLRKTLPEAQFRSRQRFGQQSLRVNTYLRPEKSLLELFEVRPLAGAGEAALPDEAVLVLHGNYRTENLTHHLREAMELFSTRLPTVYSLEHAREIFLPDVASLNTYADSLADALSFIVKELGFRRVSILAIGEGAQLLLKYLSLASLQIFEVLDKVVLLNCEFGGFRMTHAYSLHEYQQMLRDMTKPVRLELLNRLRVVSIQGRKFNRLNGPNYYQLLLSANDKPYFLKNFVALETRHLWNVYLDLSNQELLQFDPMLRLLAEFFVLDSAAPMTTRSINYFFRYREDPNPEPHAAYKQEFTLQCPEITLQLNSNTSDNQEQQDYIEEKRCKHVRFRNSEPNHSVVVEGQQGLEIYTEKYLQIPPLSNTSKLVYLLESTQNLAGIYVLNRNKEQYLISVVKPYEYTEVDVESTSIQRLLTNSRLVRFPPAVATKVCPEKPLVFPLAGTKCFNLRNGLMIQGARSNSLIFFDLENPYFEHFWHLHKNLILASLFSLYVEKGDMFMVLFYQILLNTVALWHYNMLFILLATIYTLSVAIVISKLLLAVKWICNYFPKLDPDKEFVVVLSPILFLLKRNFYRDFHINQWYAMLVGMVAVCGKTSSVLCWIFVCLNFDYIVRHEQCVLRFLIMETSMVVVAFTDRYRVCRHHLRVLDLALMSLLHIFAEQEQWLIQQLFEGYVLLLAMGLAIDYVSHRSHHYHR